MNFLAHLYLTKDQPEKVIIGNFIADAIKGNKALADFPEEIRLGIKIHRAIDEFTDRHMLFQKGSKRLHKNYGKFSPIIMDICYDHILATKWDQYCEQPLQEFAGLQYKLIERHMEHLPERTRLWFYYMKKHNLLFSYADEKGIEFVLQRMDHRTGGISGMGSAIKEIINYKAEYMIEFQDFFEQIQDHLESHFFRR